MYLYFEQISVPCSYNTALQLHTEESFSGSKKAVQEVGELDLENEQE